jgi:hypothetical protein
MQASPDVACVGNARGSVVGLEGQAQALLMHAGWKMQGGVIEKVGLLL